MVNHERSGPHGMTMVRYLPVAKLASGFTTIGLIAISPDALPAPAVAGLLIASFALMAGGLRREKRSDSVSA